MLFLFFYVLLFFKFYVSNPLLSTFFSAACSLLPCSVLLYNIIKNQHKTIITVLVTLIIIGYISSIISLNYRMEDYILCIQYFGVVFLLFKKINYLAAKSLFILLQIWFITCIFREINPNDVFFAVSRNNISVFLLIAFSSYCIACVQNKKKINNLYTLICVLIAIWSVGRGGIIAFGILLLFLPYCQQKSLKFSVLFSFILITIIACTIIMYFADTLFLTTLNRLESMGLEDIRSVVNQEYFNMAKANLENWFYGVPLIDVKSIQMLDGNPHNSFIRLHAFYGFFGFSIVILLICAACYKYYKQEQYVYILLILVLLFRASVDSAAFHGPFDPLIYFLIFNSFNFFHIKCNTHSTIKPFSLPAAQVRSGMQS